MKKQRVIYVLCPAYEKTGGTELLHQLVNQLNNINIESYITYFNTKKNNYNFTDKDFKKYIDTFKVVNEIEDDEDNLIIFPEIIKAISISNKFKNIKKVIWWLSVDNFKKRQGIKNSLKYYGLLTTLILILKGELIYSFSDIQKVKFHLCQSYYAIDYLKLNGIANVKYLSDYVSEEYLRIDVNFENKKDIVLYNPKKGFDFTKKLIRDAPELNFIPIENLTTQQVTNLLLDSKVYIDFGNHPGKDRLPREAALCGCCIITNLQGSANYDEDVPIPFEFKFEDENINIQNIIDKIRVCLNNYDEEIIKFKDYRNFIRNEKALFINSVNNIFSDNF